MRFITENHEHDGVDRRGFLRCMAWAGTGALCVLKGGVLQSHSLSEMGNPGVGIPTGELSFVQISDSHIGFNKAANPDVVATLKVAIARINALPTPPAFAIHTGDLTHLSKPEEFDTLNQALKEIRTERIFCVPGEHDFLDDTGRLYLERFGKDTMGQGWHSFDRGGVHFVGLVNVVDLQAGGLGRLGNSQLEWLEKDLEGLASSTPVVVFAHIPLWTVYPDWGWGTEDGERALSYLRRFGSVTVLNGHIHQTMQKVEGNITFHTATSTAFPQPQPGMASGPGPLTVPAEKLRSLLGVTEVSYRRGKGALAIVDASLRDDHEVAIENFSFAPANLQVPAGTNVTWVNRDDAPHKIVSADKKFAASPVLDTDDRYSFRFANPGTYGYYCSLHPKMTGTVEVG